MGSLVQLKALSDQMFSAHLTDEIRLPPGTTSAAPLVLAKWDVTIPSTVVLLASRDFYLYSNLKTDNPGDLINTGFAYEVGGSWVNGIGGRSTQMGTAYSNELTLLSFDTMDPLATAIGITLYMDLGAGGGHIRNVDAYFKIMRPVGLEVSRSI